MDAESCTLRYWMTVPLLATPWFIAAKPRRNDEVIILTGKGNAKRANVKSVSPAKKGIVAGSNLARKHKNGWQSGEAQV